MLTRRADSEDMVGEGPASGKIDPCGNLTALDHFYYNDGGYPAHSVSHFLEGKWPSMARPWWSFPAPTAPSSGETSSWSPTLTRTGPPALALRISCDCGTEGGGGICDPAGPCTLCTGDCDFNGDCQAPLWCFQRERNGMTQVPGCAISGRDIPGAEYCHGPGFGPMTRAPTCVPTPSALLPS